MYGSPQQHLQKFLWQDLNLLAVSPSSPWMLSGDFNAILHQDERHGGSIRRAQGCGLFNSFIHSIGLIDLGSNGPKFTWRRGTLLMRLDRAICNPAWLQLLPDSMVNNLPKVLSDHRPISISLGFKNRSSPPNSHFRFLALWISHPDFQGIVHRIWNSGTDLLPCIESFKTEIQKWNSETFGGIGQRKRRLFRRLNGIQHKIDSQPDTRHDFLMDLEISLREDLENVCFQEELLWIQKSSSNWMCLGDRNTSYYHLKALMRRKRNRVSQLKLPDGSWLIDEESHRVMQEDSSLTCILWKSLSFLLSLSLRGAFPKMEAHQILSLERLLTIDEVRRSLFEMKPLKSPGSMEWTGLWFLFPCKRCEAG
ncbi:hypothetical protein K1719_037872 [Acacia pycnantha]|nr:hypothetical protein K1719_037872 [Acacia pycnantha]